MKRESFLKRFLTVYLPLIVILLFILFPFYWTFITSIKPDTELYGAVTYWPRQVQWENYTKLFTTTVNFLAAMKNSFIVAAVTTSCFSDSINISIICVFKIQICRT